MASLLKQRFEFLLQSGPLAISVTYLVIGLLWIFFSDQAAFLVAGEESRFLVFSTFKGFAFIFVTAILLYAMIRYYFRKTAEERERYRALAENSRDMIFHLSLPDGIFRYVSPAAREVSGYAPEEFTGNPHIVRQIIHPAWQDPFEEVWARRLAGDIPPVLEYQIIHKSGETRWVNQRNTVLRDRDGRPIAIEGAITDVSSRKRAEEQIRLATKKLALMTDVTYQDIQNKVTALRGYVQLARKTADERERLSYLAMESEILGSIHSLISKTKDYQRMGTDQSRWIPLQAAVRMQWSLVTGKEAVTLECRLEGLEIYADSLIDQVFYNLMQNAVTHGKTVTRVRFTGAEKPAGLVITCADDGTGIPDSGRPGLFDRNVGGGKFGLFFAREFLSLSGMTIAETGGPGTGARFEITVPRELYRVTSPGSQDAGADSRERET